MKARSRLLDCLSRLHGPQLFAYGPCVSSRLKWVSHAWYWGRGAQAVPSCYFKILKASCAMSLWQPPEPGCLPRSFSRPLFSERSLWAYCVPAVCWGAGGPELALRVSGTKSVLQAALPSSSFGSDGTGGDRDPFRALDKAGQGGGGGQGLARASV